MPRLPRGVRHRRLPAATVGTATIDVEPDYIPHVDLFVAEAGGEVIGFVGLAGDAVEMLFVHDAQLGRGVGSALLRFAVDERGARRVDVNEQNPSATAFYRRRGFADVGRSPLDGQGRPYPLLHLERPR